MPLFHVPVTSESPLETMQALHGAGIPTLGPEMTKFVHGTADGPSVSDSMTAVFDAPDGEAAERRVREIVGDGPGIEPAKS